jgi:hypothetical protein
MQINLHTLLYETFSPADARFAQKGKLCQRSLIIAA